MISRRLFLKLGSLLGIGKVTGKSRTLSGVPQIIRRMEGGTGGHYVKICLPWFPDTVKVSFFNTRGEVLHERIYTDFRGGKVVHIPYEPRSQGDLPITMYHCHVVRTENGYSGRSVELNYESGVYILAFVQKPGEYCRWTAQQHEHGMVV